MIDCKEAAKQLYRYLDRQLTAEETLEVKHHLEKCPNCADHFRFEEGMLTRINQVCREVEVPPALVDRVRRICQESHRQGG